MRKVVAISLLVLALWTGAEVYKEGVDGAFNGLFAKGAGHRMTPGEPVAERATSHRTADAFQRAYDKSEDRVNALLKKSGSSDIASY